MRTATNSVVPSLQQLLHKLTDPLPFITGEQEQQGSYILSLAALITTCLSLSAFLVMYALYAFGWQVIAVVILFIGAVATYGLSRTRCYQWGKILFNINPFILFLIFIYFRPVTATLILALLPVFTASIYVQIRYTIVNSIISLSLATLFVVAFPGQWSDGLLMLNSILNINLVALTLVFVMRRLQNTLGVQKQQLLQSQERLRAAIDSSIQMFFIVEAIRDSTGNAIDFRLIDTNPTVRKEFNLVENTLVSQWDETTMPTSFVARFIDQFRTVVENREIVFDEIQFPDKGWYEYQISPIGDGVAVSSTNITDRKIAELRQIEVDREKQRVSLLKNLLDNLSHDLNTPLTIMSTSIYLATRMANDPLQITKLDQVKEQTDRLIQMIADMIALSRLDQLPEHELNRSEVDINELLETLVTSFQKINTKNQLLLLSQCNPGTVLQIDKTLIEVALSNLLDNAVHYSPEEGKIDVACHTDAKQVVFEVKDSGPGIAAEDIPHLFESFYRGAAHRPTDSGSGLGLSIARRIVEAHGGEIRAKNASEGGAVFSILLPKN